MKHDWLRGHCRRCQKSHSWWRAIIGCFPRKGKTCWYWCEGCADDLQVHGNVVESVSPGYYHINCSCGQQSWWNFFAFPFPVTCEKPKKVKV